MKTSRTLPSLRVLAMLFPAATLATVGCSGGRDAKTFAQYEQAVLAGDADGALAVVTEDFKLTDPVSGRTADRRQLAWDLEWGAAMNRTITFSRKRSRSDGLHVTVEENNDYFEALGMAPRRSDLRVVFESGGGHKISGMFVLKTTSDGKSEREALTPFVVWARAERKAELGQIYPKDTSPTATESARRWRELLGEYAENVRKVKLKFVPKETPKRGRPKPRPTTMPAPSGDAPAPAEPKP